MNPISLTFQESLATALILQGVLNREVAIINLGPSMTSVAYTTYQKLRAELLKEHPDLESTLNLIPPEEAA